MIISGQNLSMTRGDSESLTVSCGVVPFADGDSVEFTVRRYASSDRKLIYKRVTEFEDGKAVIAITPEDTAGLEFGPKIYDIQLTRADGTVTTIIKPHTFHITEEVSY